MTSRADPELVQRIRDAGPSDGRRFGRPACEDGPYLRQDSEELVAFVGFMASEIGEVDVTLGIGIASGGQTKLLRDHVVARKTPSVDNGRGEMVRHWARIGPILRSEIVLERIDDSHSPAVRGALGPWRNPVDLGHVDGDHSSRGRRQDMFLITPRHDTSAVGDCKRVFGDLLRSRNVGLLRSFDNRSGISVGRLLGRRKPQRWTSRRGYGRL